MERGLQVLVAALALALACLAGGAIGLIGGGGGGDSRRGRRTAPLLPVTTKAAGITDYYLTYCTCYLGA